MSVRTDVKLGFKSVETNDWNPGFGQNVKRGVVMKPRNRDVLRVLGCVWKRLDKVAPMVTDPPSANSKLLQNAPGKYQNCHLVLKGSFWFFFVLFVTCHLPPRPVCKNSITTVARTFQENQACLNTYWWSMEPDIPQKYCKTVTWPSWWLAEGSALLYLLHRLQD